MKSETKICQNCKQDFTIESDDFSFYEKIKVPPPTFCPQCRMIRRLRNRNERVLYKAQCGLCSTSIFTIYHPDNHYTTYCSSCFSGDGWDQLSYGRDYDFSKPFFVQFRELQKSVPHKARHEVSSQNCDYANYVLNSKDIYLSFTTTDSNWIYYSRSADRCNECMDCYNIIDCEGCYQCIQSSKCASSSYLIDCRDCVSSSFLFDAVNCTDCFMSSNCRNKQYLFRNEQLTKDEYKEKMEHIKLYSVLEKEKLQKEFSELVRNSIHRYAVLTGSNNCSGDNIVRSNNVKESFHATETENTKYVMRTVGLKDSYDVLGSLQGELLYEVHGGARGSRNSHFIAIGNATIDSEYTDFCLNVSNVFGSVSLQGKQYCILNKQYTKEEYSELVSRIKKHMVEMPYVDNKGHVYSFGEYFPDICIPFGYNESAAQEFFPLSKEQIGLQGYVYYEPVIHTYVPTISKEKLSNNFDQYDEKITDEIIECKDNGSCTTHRCVGVFKITKEEVLFYQKYKLSLPTQCPNCRHYERLVYVHMPKLHNRICSNGCGTAFETTYSPERPEKVYCESYYQKAVL